MSGEPPLGMPNKPPQEMTAEELEQCAKKFRVVYAALEAWMLEGKRDKPLALAWDQAAWICWGIRMMGAEIDARRVQEDKWLMQEASRQKQH